VPSEAERFIRPSAGDAHEGADCRGSLVGHRLLRNPASHKDLATGQMNQDQARQHKLDAKFYKNLLVRTLRRSWGSTCVG